MGYHMSCLVPCLVDVPEGNWYCPDCSEVFEEKTGEYYVCLIYVLFSRLDYVLC